MDKQANRHQIIPELGSLQNFLGPKIEHNFEPDPNRIDIQEGKKDYVKVRCEREINFLKAQQKNFVSHEKILT